MTRIQLELPDDKVRQLDELMKETGLRTKKELLSNALTLLGWAVRETKAGRAISSVDEREKRYKEILLPALENVAILKTVGVLPTDSIEASSREASETELVQR